MKIILMDQQRDIVFSYLKLIFHTTCKDSCCTKSSLRKWYYSLLNTALDWTEEHGMLNQTFVYFSWKYTEYLFGWSTNIIYLCMWPSDKNTRKNTVYLNYFSFLNQTKNYIFDSFELIMRQSLYCICVLNGLFSYTSSNHKTA